VKRASVRVGTEVELQQRQYDVSVREVSLANWYGVKVECIVRLLHRRKTTIRQPQVRLRKLSVSS